MQLAQATPVPRAVETVTVTSSKIGGDVQNIPIAITALSQEQLTATQTAGGPDLVKQVPNMTFTKTNFTGYSIQFRGIGTQAISVTTDPAVAVAFNDIPFIRNHFFEQEFYDVSQVEVLRGPQGTLYGRNATAGVVNLISAKPTDQFEAMASADIGNYQQRRFEGMINIPIVDDRARHSHRGRVDEAAGLFVQRTHRQPHRWPRSVVRPRDDRLEAVENCKPLSSGSISQKTMIACAPPSSFAKPTDSRAVGRRRASRAIRTGGLRSGELLSARAVDRLRSIRLTLSRCRTVSRFRSIAALGRCRDVNRQRSDPYASTTQSQNLRVIESRHQSDLQGQERYVELNADYAVTPALTFTSQTGFNHDFLWSTEDYNRFNIDARHFCGLTGNGLSDSRIPQLIPMVSRRRRILRSATGLQRPACRCRIFRMNMPGS